jgi:hypothetical protein
MFTYSYMVLSFDITLCLQLKLFIPEHLKLRYCLTILDMVLFSTSPSLTSSHHRGLEFCHPIFNLKSHTTNIDRVVVVKVSIFIYNNNILSKQNSKFIFQKWLAEISPAP